MPHTLALAYVAHALALAYVAHTLAHLQVEHAHEPPHAPPGHTSAIETGRKKEKNSGEHEASSSMDARQDIAKRIRISKKRKRSRKKEGK
jgi:hypothetical protein